MSRVLILTATITPPSDAAGVRRLDPALRLNDYRVALDFYIDFLGRDLNHIVFAENTESDLASLEELVRKRGVQDQVTFLSFNGNSFPPKYGRCYGEALILDHVMQSSVVQVFPDTIEFWKVTGRYRVLNLHKMIAHRPHAADFYIDLRSHARPPWADLRVISWTRRGYNASMRGIAPLIREDLDGYRAGEHVAFEEISKRIAVSRIKAVTVWTTEPLIDGYRAYDSKNWSQGRQLAVFLLRSVQRRVLKRIIM